MSLLLLLRNYQSKVIHVNVNSYHAAYVNSHGFHQMGMPHDCDNFHMDCLKMLWGNEHCRSGFLEDLWPCMKIKVIETGIKLFSLCMKIIVSKLKKVGLEVLKCKPMLTCPLPPPPPPLKTTEVDTTVGYSRQGKNHIIWHIQVCYIYKTKHSAAFHKHIHTKTAAFQLDSNKKMLLWNITEIIYVKCTKRTFISMAKYAHSKQQIKFNTANSCKSSRNKEQWYTAVHHAFCK